MGQLGPTLKNKATGKFQKRSSSFALGSGVGTAAGNLGKNANGAIGGANLATMAGFGSKKAANVGKIEKVKTTFKVLGTQIVPAATAAIKIFGAVLAGLAIGSVINAIEGELTGVSDHATEATKGLGIFKAAWVLLPGVISEANNKIQNFTTEQDKLKSSTGQLTNEVNSLQGEYEVYGDSVQKAKVETDKFADNKIEGVRDVIDALAFAWEDVAGKVLEASLVQNKVFESAEEARKAAAGLSAQQIVGQFVGATPEQVIALIEFIKSQESAEETSSIILLIFKCLRMNHPGQLLKRHSQSWRRHQ